MKTVNRDIHFLVMLLVCGYAGTTVRQVTSANAKQSNVAPSQTIPELIPREKEIELALSAAPEDLCDGAGVYVFERNGYVKVRESTNGFTCIVNRDHSLSLKPACFDAEGTATIQPRRLTVLPTQPSHPFIERTSSGKLRLPPAAARVKR
jgi:hypothetical protein